MATNRRFEKQPKRDSAQPAPHGPKLPRVELRSYPQNRHPWVFRRMVAGEHPELPPGALVEVVDRDGEFFGYAFYNANSEIALRILSYERSQPVNAQWFRDKIARAVEFRHDVLKLPARNDAYRVVHSEGDGLSGLVVDRLGSVLVLELFSAGMHRNLGWIQAALKTHYPNLTQIVRADQRSEKHEGLEMDGPPPPESLREVVIHEANLKFRVDLRDGHKTGFFTDQRENRVRTAELCRGEDVFDGFCYTGGFAMAAALHGAKRVEAMDLDENAVAIAERNQELNGIGPNLQFRHGNVFHRLRDMRATNTQFARMILDPSKQAIARHEINKALDAYCDMNRMGMQCVKPGGILVSCSCTGLVSEEMFLDVLRAAAGEAGVELQILAVTGAAADHPFAIRVPEGRYLKVVYSRVLPSS